MSIYLYDSDSYIYAIIKESTGQLKLQYFRLELDSEPTELQLRQFYRYSASLGDQYSSDLGKIAFNVPMSDVQRKVRRKAIAFQQTAEKIRNKYDVVAISHRQGGWTTFTWNYNEDISFEVYSNFGYGSCSELLSRFYYKDVQLTPYSEYIRYRYANYSQIIRYTYNYQLRYEEWKRLMEDTLRFYYAVCENQENEVFRWITNHLSDMTSGLKRLLDSTYEFVFVNINNVINRVTGNELICVKAEKIGGACEFVTNIEKLPSQINPEKYVKQLEEIFDQYLSYSNRIKIDLIETIDNLQKEINSISQMPSISIYDRLYKRYYRKEWFRFSNRKLIRHLLNLHHRLGNPFTLSEIRTALREIETQKGKRDNLQSKQYDKKRILEAIEDAQKKITEHFEQRKSKRVSHN